MKKFLTLLLLNFSLSTFAIDLESLKARGYKVYRIKEGETLSTIAKRLHKELNYKFQNPSDFEKFLTEWNPHLKMLQNPTGQYIFVNNPYPPQLDYKWAPNLYQTEEQAMAQVDFVDLYQGGTEQKRAPASTSSKANWVRFFHASISQGKFLDDIGGNKINSQQNSPFTIGAGFVYLLESYKDYSVASSLYYSNLQSNNVNDTSGTIENKNLNLPAEVGLNVYLQKNLSGTISNIYGGVDYEEFNVLNFDKILDQTSTNLDSERQKIYFITGGLGLSFNFIKPSTMKLSASQGLASNTDINGSKYMVYFNQKITNNFWYHVLYKQHLLSENDRELSISRYGIGVGMAF